MSNRKARAVLVSVGAAAMLLAAPGYLAWSHLFARGEPVPYDSVEELFKYGSMGAERRGGMPFWIWKVLPDAFPYLMPADSGYRAFGFIWEEGREVPLGLTLERIGFPRVGVNCAMCHVSRYRASPDDEPTFFLAGANTVFDAQAYFNFLFDAANEPRFNAETLLPYIERETELSASERFVYRNVLIPKTREMLRLMQNRLSWWYRIPEIGPGRWEAFNDLKYAFAAQPQDRSVGNPDIPPIWSMRARQEIGSLHWDGFSDDVLKSAQNAAVGGGAMEEDLPREELNRLVQWLMDQPPPPFPFPLERALADQGREVWKAECASCHQIGHPAAGRVIAIDSIGTDRARFDLITPATVESYNRVATEWFGWQEPQIRKTAGYAAVLLDGVWLRAPYLHNGSVPTIADLLEPPAQRPVTFYRGYDVYDPAELGFVSRGAGAEAVGFLYDTRLRGNGNGGHLWGTELPAPAKRALIEYLKTF